MKFYKLLGYCSTPEKRARADRRMRRNMWAVIIFEVLFVAFFWLVTRK